MNKVIKDKWSKDLRSGKFKQGVQSLKTGKSMVDNKCSYCCLGVLTYIYCEETGETWEEVTRYSSSILPDKVKIWAEMRSHDGIYKNTPLIEGSELLMEDNDGLKHSFNKIADTIDRVWETL